MRNTELQRLLDRLGLTQSGAARELQITDRSMRRYCAGHSEVPRSLALALKYLATAPKERVAPEEWGQK